MKKGNLYLIIYLSSAYFTLKWDSIIPARNRWPWKISQVLCIFQYKSWVFFNGHKIEWFKIKAFVIECYLYIQVMSHSKLSKHYGNRLYFVWGCYLIKKRKKIVESTESTRIIFESSGLICKRAWPVLLKHTSLNVYISILTIDPLENTK